MIIGITGNSGTGKTSLCKAIKENYKNKTITILDADKIAKELLVPGKEYFNEVVNLFGKKILTVEGTINRKKLATIIFSEPKKRKALDVFTYKYVVEEVKKQTLASKSKINIIDAPLLIESGLNRICDVVISVIASRKTKLDRICKRDNIDEKAASLRLKSQKQDDFYIKNSNYVFVNNNVNLEKQAKEIIDFLKSNCINNQVVILQDGDLKLLQFKELLKFNKLIHAFTLKPLDFGSNNTYQNIKQEVQKNYESLCNFLQIDLKGIIRPYQTHTKNVLKLKGENGIFPKELLDVDGLITDKNDKVLSLVFADCTPIFIYDKSKNIIGNIHSGWQGTLKKIAKQAIYKLKEEFNSKPEDIICAIGPTIRKCHFEVEEDVKNKFVEEFKEICKEEEFISKGKLENGEQKYNIDTVYLNKKMLLDIGILEGNIIDCNICTVCNSNLMHSYRAEKENAGRSTSVICIKRTN